VNILGVKGYIIAVCNIESGTTHSSETNTVHRRTQLSEEHTAQIRAATNIRIAFDSMISLVEIDPSLWENEENRVNNDMDIEFRTKNK